METRANYVIVGLFTVVAILAAFGFVYWTAGVGTAGNTAPVRFRIPGSAAGLATGSAVLFNGVRVGSVERVHLDPANPRVAIAEARVDRDAPITKSTTAEVGLASLTTGQANIELAGGNPKEENLIEQAAKAGTVAELTANPSAVTNLLQTAQSLMSRADAVMDQLEGFAKDARGPLTETVHNAQTFSQALARNADGVNKFLESVSSLSDTLSGVSDRLDSTLKSANSLLDSVDRDKVAKSVSNIEQFTGRLDRAGRNLDKIMNDVGETVASLNAFSNNANRTLSKVDELVSGVDPEQVRGALKNFEQASETARRVAGHVASVTEKVSERKEDIDQFITNAGELAARLNKASTRIDDVLARLDSLLGSEDTKSVMAETRETLKAYRKVADTLNAKVGTITDNLSRFSGKGLRDVEALVSESRQAVRRIERAISSLEKNPQRIITGGEGTVRRYNGRLRR